MQVNIKESTQMIDKLLERYEREKDCALLDEIEKELEEQKQELRERGFIK